MANSICGIDFGTSNTAIAVGSTGDINLIQIEDSEVTIPTAVFFNLDESTTTFGRKAIREYLDGYSGRLMRSLKSVLGSSLINEVTQIGYDRIDFKQIIGLFVAHIKNIAQDQTNEVLESVVIGRPVNFVDDDIVADNRAEKELQSIAESQGFRNVSFEFEPIAAARDYESRLEREELVLVADIGGGTSDFSLIRLSPTKRDKTERKEDILANSGVHIGGTDFDKHFSLETVLPDMGYKSKLNSGLDMPIAPYQDLATWHKINSLYNKKTKGSINELYTLAARKDLVSRFVYVVEHQRGHELANAIELAKIALSTADSSALDLNFIERAWIKSVTQEQLKASISTHVSKVVSVGKKAVVELAGIKAADVKTVFMTGGSTSLPGFEAAIRSEFPQSQIVYGDKFSSVAVGLGIAAARRYS